MIGRLYYAAFRNIDVTNDADQDVIELVNGSTKKLEIHAISITSAQGATAAEVANLAVVRRSAAGTGGTAALTIEDADPDNDTTSGVTSVKNTVTTPGAISGVAPLAWQWSQQGELLWLPTPEVRLYVPKSGILAVNLATALGGTRKWSGYIAWAEL